MMKETVGMIKELNTAVKFEFLGFAVYNIYTLDIDYVNVNQEKLKKLFIFLDKHCTSKKHFGAYPHTVWTFDKKDNVGFQIKLLHE